jgi:hypothetical protein
LIPHSPDDARFPFTNARLDAKLSADCAPLIEAIMTNPVSETNGAARYDHAFGPTPSINAVNPLTGKIGESREFFSVNIPGAQKRALKESLSFRNLPELSAWSWSVAVGPSSV